MFDRKKFLFCVLQECLIELMQEMFGENSVPTLFRGESFFVTVNKVKAHIDLNEMVSWQSAFELIVCCWNLICEK